MRIRSAIVGGVLTMGILVGGAGMAFADPGTNNGEGNNGTGCTSFGSNGASQTAKDPGQSNAGPNGPGWSTDFGKPNSPGQYVQHECVPGNPAAGS